MAMRINHIRYQWYTYIKYPNCRIPVYTRAEREEVLYLFSTLDNNTMPAIAKLMGGWPPSRVSKIVDEVYH